MDLQQFCSVGEKRTCLNAPFDFDGYRFGTDRWLLVGIPHDTRGIPNTPDLQEHIQTFLSGVVTHLGEGTCVPACDLKMPELRPCTECNSTGRMWEDEIEVHCTRCTGAGKIGQTPIKIGSVGFSAGLISRLLVLPELRFFPDSESLRAYFVFADGGIGAVSGLKIEADVAGGAT